MAASIAKNEPTAAKRRALVVVLGADQGHLWRGASLAGRAFVSKSAPSCAAALGTFTNYRKPHTFTAFTFTADSSTDKLTKSDHGLETGDGAVTASNSGGGLPGGLAAATDYWIIRINANEFKLATSLANAYLGTAIDITSNGTGTQTLTAGGAMERGLDGDFQYEFTQGETNVDGSELLVVIDDKQRVFTADSGTDAITLTGHELRTGNVVAFSTAAGTLPAEITANTLYFVIRVDANSFKIALTFANALAGTVINLTTSGSGVLYVEPAVFRSRTSVGLTPSVSSFLDDVAENGVTWRQALLGVVRQNLATRTKSGTTETTRNLGNTKDSHHGTVTASGRVATIDDLNP